MLRLVCVVSFLVPQRQILTDASMHWQCGVSSHIHRLDGPRAALHTCRHPTRWLPSLNLDSDYVALSCRGVGVGAGPGNGAW